MSNPESRPVLNVAEFIWFSVQCHGDDVDVGLLLLHLDPICHVSLSVMMTQ